MRHIKCLNRVFIFGLLLGLLNSANADVLQRGPYLQGRYFG